MLAFKLTLSPQTGLEPVTYGVTVVVSDVYKVWALALVHQRWWVFYWANTSSKMSDRIQVRAIRRAGELLRQIDSKAGGDRQSKHYVGDHTMLTRTQAAKCQTGYKLEPFAGQVSCLNK